MHFAIIPVLLLHIAPAWAANGACTTGLYSALLPLSSYAPAQSFCSPKYPIKPCTSISQSTVTTTLPTTGATAITTYTTSTSTSYTATITSTSVTATVISTIATATQTVTSFTSTSSVTNAASTVIECTVGGNAPRNYKRGEGFIIYYKSTMHGKRFILPRTVTTPASTSKSSSTTTSSTKTSSPTSSISKTSSTTSNPQATLFSQLVSQASGFVSTLCSCIEAAPVCATSVVVVASTVYSTLTATSSVQGFATLQTAKTTVICT
ncbi:hypothetical protein EG327_010632 [Venturia inaequalis]|uniref:Uncharacterized protein n=1 Tax=Venturia inaequalis TaxID=5025 RepID=A0A8H3UGB9_VENIN|nr:hypothetical protein EG327_010632 [Venturia inaequalis]